MNDPLIFTQEIMLRDQAIDLLAESGKLNQSFLYMTEGASSFYRYRDSDLARMQSEQEFAFFQSHSLFYPETIPALISLGCGNGGAEADLITSAMKHGVCPAYFGVDSSAAMLKLADRNLSRLSVNPVLILGDFSSPDFSGKLAPYIRSYDSSIYLLMGGTFGNVDQQRMATLLSQIIPEKQYLYLDVVPLEKGSAFIDLKDRFSKLPDNYTRFFQQILKRLRIPSESGTITSDDLIEKQPQALRTTFRFTPDRNISLCFINTTIDLDAGESIELLTIRAYERDSLIAFIESHGFHFISPFIPVTNSLKHGWQRILFQRSR